MASINEMINLHNYKYGRPQGGDSAFGTLADIMYSRSEEERKRQQMIQDEQRKQQEMIQEEKRQEDRYNRFAELSQKLNNQQFENTAVNKAEKNLGNIKVGAKNIKLKTPPPEAMMSMPSGEFGDVQGNIIPNTQPEVMARSTPIPRGGTRINYAPEFNSQGKAVLNSKVSNTPDELSSLYEKVASAGVNPAGMDMEQAYQALAEVSKKEESLSPSLRIRKEKRVEDLITSVEINKEKRQSINMAKDALKRISSGIYGRVDRGFSKSLAPGSAALGDYQIIKSMLTDAQLAYVAYTKGAISNAEMDLFQQAAANDELLSEPRVLSVFDKLERFMKAEERSKLKTYNKLYGEDPLQWDEMKDYREDSGGGSQMPMDSGSGFNQPTPEEAAAAAQQGYTGWDSETGEWVR